MGLECLTLSPVAEPHTPKVGNKLSSLVTLTAIVRITSIPSIMNILTPDLARRAPGKYSGTFTTGVYAS